TIGPRNCEKFFGFEARPAHQSAVDLGEGEQFPCIRSLYGSPVKNADRIAVLFESRAQTLASEFMHLGNVCRHGAQSGADRPNRLIGENSVPAVCTVWNSFRHLRLAATQAPSLIPS